MRGKFSGGGTGDPRIGVLDAVSAALMFAAIFCIVFSFAAKQEPEDQLSREHFLLSCTITLSGIAFVLMVLTCLSAFFILPDVFLASCLPFAIGILLLSTGLIWIVLEKPWEDTEE